MKSVVIILFFLFIAASCKEKYEVLLAPALTSFLVVEGSIVTNGITKINLSRTTFLDERKIQFEKEAEITIEKDDNTLYPLVYKDSGTYELPFSNLDENAKYRLNIKTHDNREYVSEYVEAIKTPEVDTITWTRYNDGIEIYVDAKDPENNTQYYRFEYDETWEFLSPYPKRAYNKFHETPSGPWVEIGWIDTSALHRPVDSIDNCWQFRGSTKILLGTTARLSENRIYMPLISYPRGAWEFSHLYSINVKQFGISKQEYDFLQKMKRNTESLGTIFDAQPSELTGNFRCLTDTAEKIIGYVGATRYREKRTFIDNKDLTEWNYDQGCTFLTIPHNQDTLLKYFYYEYRNIFEVIEFYVENQYDTINYQITLPVCLDCTVRGTNKKPSYWP